MTPEQAQILVARQAELRAFAPAMLARNIEPADAAFRDHGIKGEGKQIRSMTPTEDLPNGKPGQVYVEFSDGSSGTYDQVVIAHGTRLDNPAHPGPAGALTLTEGMDLRPVLDHAKVVALESIDPPGAVRVIGAAMWSAAWIKRISAPFRPIYEDALAHQARTAPRDSRGAGLLHGAGEQIPLANERLRKGGQ